MIQAIQKHPRGIIEFKTDKPKWIKPKVSTEKVIDGVRYYFEGKRRFVADAFDKFFNPQVRVQIKSLKWKGENNNKKHAWIQDEKSY